MLQHGGGAIVNNASIAGMIADPGSQRSMSPAGELDKVHSAAPVPNANSLTANEPLLPPGDRPNG